MNPKRILLTVLLSLFAGNLVEVPIHKNPKVCIPCTPYCKAHPNSPRCN